MNLTQPQLGRKSVNSSPDQGASFGLLGADGESLTPRGLGLLLLTHVIVWTVAAAMAQSSGAVHHDMTEAYDWGREFQLGYQKHPPGFAWMAGAWFLIFPRTDWAFYLLSAVNAAGGLTGFWLLAGRLLPARGQSAALLLVMLTPLFSVLAITFNANAMLLLIWPWTLWAFVRSLQTAVWTAGLLFGVLAALALLSKYNSIFLLAACLAAALLHDRRSAYFGSLAPYAAIAAAMIVCLPHLIWVLQHRLTTVTYVLEKAQWPFLALLAKAGTSLLGSAALFCLPEAAVVASVGWGGALQRLSGVAKALVRRDTLWLTALTAGPLVLTIAAGFATGVKLSTNYFLPTLLMLPVASLVLGNPRIDDIRLGVLLRFLAAWLGVALLAAPLVAFLAFATHTSQAVEPRREIALEATRIWHEAIGGKLRIVAGSDAYGLGAPFYSPDAPRLFIASAPEASPWIKPEDLAREGYMVICEHLDWRCVAEAAALPTARRRVLRIDHRFLGWAAPSHDFDLFLVPPAVTVPAAQ